MIGLNRPPSARPPAICSADNVYIHHAFYGSALSTREKSCTRSRGAQVRFTKVDSVWVTKRPLVVCIADNVREAKFGTNMHFSQFALTLYPGKLLAKHSYYERSISQRKRGLFTVKATIEQPSSSASQDLQESKVKVFPAVIGLPGSLWRQILRPLSNFGFGNRSVWEGGVGIFVISGAILLFLTIGWVKGYQIRNRTQKYHAVIEFSKACGIRVGTPVRIRGVDVGNVINVKPSLESIDVSIQILDSKVVIPRNSVVEVNQSGLLMDTLIDITPPNQLPEPTVSPLDPRCSEEGMIVCDRQRLKGEQGVNLDDLVGLFTRLAREVDEIGISEIYSLADRVSKTVEDAKPLLSKVYCQRNCFSVLEVIF
ncbi:hypothetical protein KP509_21G037400 [Ceratopteris richardii]|uniref:Mce/MlaD domain-containing protein n=1 Tax=Ceratopteris richardii TaxID=49495 RepID=A0A8T2SCD1_CERRI|nr:hypothetical protein KP509_21G037400 [Ceratopteris richardii]